MIALIITACVFAVCLLILTLLCRHTYKKAFYSNRNIKFNHYKGLEEGTRYPNPDKCRLLIDDMLALKTERVECESHDGLRLVGHYCHVKDGAPLEIMFHGFRSSWQRDFCGISRLVREIGHNILFVDQRAHGESEGHVISYGINERRDLMRWVDYAISRFGKELSIVLVGVSMGGATVLSAANLPLPENVKAIAADSPFSSPLDIIVSVGTRGGLPAPAVAIAARLTARMLGFSLVESSAKEALVSARVPVLIAHGVEDRLVPHYMAEELAGASERVRLESFEGADHVGAFLSYPERYRALYKEFLREQNLL